MEVLIISNDDEIKGFIKDIVTTEEPDKLYLDSGITALQLVETLNTPLLIILDWELKSQDSSLICDRIRHNMLEYQPFIIALTDYGNTDKHVRILEEGADLALMKPVDPRLLKAKIRVARRIIDKQNETLQLHRELEALANTDSLTQIHNRRYGLEMIEKNLARLSRQRDDKVGCLVLCDLDDFKVVNDTYGHSVGDEVLIEFCHRINTQIRSFDEFCRYGGEEFLIYCEMVEKALPSFAERMRSLIASKKFDIESEKLTVTSSFGMVYFSSHIVRHKNIEELINAADKALYEAKNGGKNRAVIHRADFYSDKITKFRYTS